jgi:hypothetical protein
VLPLQNADLSHYCRGPQQLFLPEMPACTASGPQAIKRAQSCNAAREARVLNPGQVSAGSFYKFRIFFSEETQK